MRNVLYVGMCWTMTLGLVAVALGQQQPETVWRNGPQLAPQAIDTTGLPIEQQPSQAQPATGLPAVFVPASDAIDAQRNAANEDSTLREKPAIPAPASSQIRSLITGTNQPAQPAMNNGQPRRELGVWMGESGGAGVQVLRITGGSGAERAGLRVGDIILQVNGRGATSPHDTARLIRQIAIGETGTLTIWRDGNQQQVQVTLQPVREIARESVNVPSQQVGFGPSELPAGDLASRTMRLEQQINSLTQELATLRQELAQLRTTGPVQTGFNADANKGTPPRETTRYNITTIPAPERANSTAAPAIPTAPTPAFEPSKEKPAEPVAAAAKQAAPTPTTPEPTPAPAAPAKAADKSPNDLFGSDTAQPTTQEKPKTENKPKPDDKGASDDLFK